MPYCSATMLRTLRDIHIGSREPVRSSEGRVHGGPVLRSSSAMTRTEQGGLELGPRDPTDSSTPPRAFSSASMFSFFCDSSAKDRCAALPFVIGRDEGPEGTVGAWRFSILNERSGAMVVVGRSGRPWTSWDKTE